MNTPELNPGETYAGAIINPDGTGHHIILLPGDHGEQHASSSDYAWCQIVYYGTQNHYLMVSRLRARAVRRLII